MTARNRQPPAPAASASGRPLRGATGRGDGRPAVEAPFNKNTGRRAGRAAVHSPQLKAANAAKKQAAVDAAYKRLVKAGFKLHVLRARPKGPALGRVWTLASLGAPVKLAVAKAIAEGDLFDYLEKERKKGGKVRGGCARGLRRGRGWRGADPRLGGVPEAGTATGHGRAGGGQRRRRPRVARPRRRRRDADAGRRAGRGAARPQQAQPRVQGVPRRHGRQAAQRRDRGAAGRGGLAERRTRRAHEEARAASRGNRAARRAGLGERPEVRWADGPGSGGQLGAGQQALRLHAGLAFPPGLEGPIHARDGGVARELPGAAGAAAGSRAAHGHLQPHFARWMPS
jgi:hypothetical protein